MRYQVSNSRSIGYVKVIVDDFKKYYFVEKQFKRFQPLLSNLLRLAVWTCLALGIWVNSEEALVVDLAQTSAAANFLWLVHLCDLWCVRTNLACLSEGTVDLTHVIERPDQTVERRANLPFIKWKWL